MIGSGGSTVANASPGQGFTETFWESRIPMMADGLEDVALTIDIEEEWFPKGIPAEVARSIPAPDK